MRGAFARFSPIVAGQLTLAILALLLVAFAPPAEGRMLLVPLGGDPVTETMIAARHATPLRPGPVPGSWVVDGNRAMLSELLMSKGIAVLAAPAALCGGPASNESYPS